MFLFLGRPFNADEVSMLGFDKQASKTVLVLEMKCFQCSVLLYALFSIVSKMTAPTGARPQVD